MLYCGSYSYLKDNLVQVVGKIQAEKLGDRLTFIVHSNRMKSFLKEYLVRNLGIVVNSRFYTLIDISKEIANIEPLSDFEKK